MKILVENLGPIKKGEIPLNSDLLFFVGYNNSGKSYATQLIWAIYNEEFRGDFIDDLNLNKITKVKKLENFFFTLSIATKLLKEFEIYIQNKIHTIYNLHSDHFENFNIKFIPKNHEIESLVEKKSGAFTIYKGTGKNKKIITIKRDATSNKISFDGELSDIDFEILKRKMIEFYFFHIIDSAQSFFLPAIRGAYVNLFQYINRYEKEKKDMIDEFIQDTEKGDLNKVIALIEESNSSYTRATNYLIQKLTELTIQSHESSKYTEFLDIVSNII